MKSITLKLITLLAFAVPAFAAEEGHSHEKKNPGPNGGRVITTVEPHLEFLVTKDRKVAITALTKDLKPVPLYGQVIAVTAGERGNPTKLEFKEEGGRLISTNSLPAGNDFPVSISIKATAEGKAVYEKFNLNMANCPECSLPEYACTCSH